MCRKTNYSYMSIVQTRIRMLLNKHMALFKYFPTISKEGDSKNFLPISEEIKKADEFVTKAIVSSKSTSRGKYNSYTAQDKAQIGKRAPGHGPTKAAVHFRYCLAWSNES